MKLYKKVICPRCGDSPASDLCTICRHGKVLQELDPADLEKLEAGYYRAWEELKERIVKDKTTTENGRCQKNRMDCDAILATYKCVAAMIADLESRLPIPKAVIKARAWEKLRKKYQSLPMPGINREDRDKYRVIKGAVLADIVDVLKKARSDLLPSSLTPCRDKSAHVEAGRDTGEGGKGA